MKGAAIQTDPALVAAIMLQTEEMKKIYEKRSEHHNMIQSAQIFINGALDKIHSVEDKMLEYLSNASGVIQNMYQIKKIAELATVDIPENLVKLSKDIPSNIKGTGITLFVNKTITETTADITALSDIVNRLVTSNYSFKDKKDDKNINLLSAAERFSILQSVCHKLEEINWRLFVTRYCIRTFSWQQLWMGLDRESWCKIMYSKMMANHLIDRWKRL